MNSKEKILYEALKLFARDGYSAVSTRAIAHAAGMSDTAIYKHYKNKQEMFDTIIDTCKERFKKEREKADLEHIHWNQVEDTCMEMFKFQVTDEWIVLFRQILVIEQFKNKEIANVYKSFFVDIAVDGMAEMFEELMRLGYMKKGNAMVYSMELYAPFFMYHTFGTYSEEILSNLREHVKIFRENTQTDMCKEENKHGLSNTK